MNRPIVIQPPPLQNTSGLYNFKPSNTRKIATALAKVRRLSSSAKIALIGDSTIRGTGAHATANLQWQNGIPRQLSNMLNAAATLNNGVLSSWQNLFGNGSSSASDPVLHDSRVVVSGTFAPAGVSVPGGLTFRANGAGTLSFTPTTNVNTFIVYYYQNGTGGFTTNFDGGATITTVNVAGTKSVQTSTVTDAGSAGAHTLNIVYTSGTIFILGIEAYDSALKELRVWNWGRGGATSTYWNDSTDVYSPIPMMATAAPDAFIIDLGINDWNTSGGNIALATHITNMQAIITAAKAVGDVILMSPAPSDTATISSAAYQQGYVDAQRSLAVTNDIPFIDAFARFGSYTSANALGMYSDTLHPNDIGYSDQAMLVSRALLSL